MELIIITGPQGCGKSANARFFKAHYKADQVIHEYVPGMALPSSGRVLALTNIPAADLAETEATVIDWDKALRVLEAREVSHE